ncbi:MAG: alpha-amylase family glycosyl hydrolase [Nitrospinota bacterium]|nr:hypothetical protein [Nitrospinota bacterium]
MNSKLKESEIEKITGADVHNPFLCLGPHKTKTTKGEYVTIRAYIPNARQVKVLSQKYTPAIYLMHRIEKTDIFETVTDQQELFPYKIEIEWKEGAKDITYDPYSFPSTISEEEQGLLKEGKHYSSYETLGGRRKKINGVEGTRFALWAPNARRASVVGDFNYWDGRRHMMRLLGESGIWEIFIPGLKDGDKYKFELKIKGGGIHIKSDPYARYAELRPKNASILCNTDDWEWGDKKWMERRRNTGPLERHLSIYEVHLGSWHKNKDNGDFLNYREIAPLLAKYVKKIGYTHVELMPIQEHPFGGSWGYQLTGFFFPTGRFGTPEDFLYFIDYLHRHNIGVIMDWVPAFPADEQGLSNFDGTSLYEYSDQKRGKQQEGETLIFNFGRKEVINFLISNVMFWCRKYHIDGIRVGSVSSMPYPDYGPEDGGKENLEAIEFLKEMNIVLHSEFPSLITINKESTS